MQLLKFRREDGYTFSCQEGSIMHAILKSNPKYEEVKETGKKNVPKAKNKVRNK